MNETLDASAEAPCHFLSWDSEFWGFPIARVRGNTLTPDRLVSIDRWCEAQSITCLYFLATFDDPITVRSAEAGGFRLVDAKITFGCDSERLVSSQLTGPLGIDIRPAVESNLDPLRPIAAESFHGSRFYFDDHFPREKCDMLYERWLVESFNGYADQIFVAARKEQPIGFVTCHMPTIGEGVGSIGLFSVAADERRRGVGRALHSYALDWFAEQDVRQVTVATQGRNIAMQALNQRCGFATLETQLWYHKWYLSPDPQTP